MTDTNDIIFDPILGELREQDPGSGSGGGGSGTVTGIAASVSGGTATITATGSTTSVKFTGVGGVDVKGNTTTGAIEFDVSDLADGTQSITKDLKEARFVSTPVGQSTVTAQNALTIAHISDLHADAAALARIVADVGALSGVSDIICTGDMVEMEGGPIASWWAPSVLTCIGNHECFDEDADWSWTAVDMAQRNAWYIAPFEANWGANHASGTSYYYKDYTQQKVRMVVMDAMLYYGSTQSEAATQTAWLESLLDSAISSGYHVVIACHAPIGGSKAKPCSFSQRGYGPNAPTDTIGVYLPASIPELVAAKKQSGLNFVGYLCGHLHRDVLWDVYDDGSQYMFGLVCTNVDTMSRWAKSDLWRDDSLDAYNLVTIDTLHNRVTLVRGGGANVDLLMRGREGITIDYSSGQVIDRETARQVSSEVAGNRLDVDNGVLNFADYTSISEVSGSTVMLKAGKACYIEALDSGSPVTLTADTPSGMWGLDGHLTLVMGASGSVLTDSNVELIDELHPSATNYCRVRFLDGVASLFVENYVSASGYIVVSATGTADGSLYYGLTGSTETTIMFGNAVDSQTVDLGGAVTNSEKALIGNGYTKTIVSGGISCTSATTFTGMSLDGVVVSGGTPTFDGVNIPAGNLVSISGAASIEPVKVEGDGTFDLANATITDYNAALKVLNKDVDISGVTFTGCTFNPLYTSDCVLHMSGCVFSGNSNASNYIPGPAIRGGSAYVHDCVFERLSGTSAIAPVHCANSYKYLEVVGCTFTSCYGQAAAFAANLGNVTSTYITSCTFNGNNAQYYGAINVYSGGATIEGCTFSSNTRGNVTGRTSATVYISNCSFVYNKSGPVAACNTDGGMVKMYLSNCDISHNSTSMEVLVNAGASVFLNTCNVSANAGASNTLLVSGGALVISGGTVSGNASTDITAMTKSNGVNIGTIHLIGCTISGNTNTSGVDVDATQGGKVYISGGVILGHGRVNGGGSMIILGSDNAFDIVDNTGGSATILISSGAVMSLTSSMIVNSGTITVADGGCVVNGATIAAGTYTQIVSSGGSAVAS